MADQYKIATIFGGTGFIGRQVVRELAKADYRIKVATRVPERAYFLRPNGVVGQIVPVPCDYNDPDSIAGAVEGADVAVNCIGILSEKRKGGFRKAHIDIPMAIANASDKAGVEQLVHISALGIDESPSEYGRTKREGEAQVRKYFPGAIILRPSVVFGPEDRFFNMFAELARYVPVLPLIGGGKTRLQPVFVGDVADAVMAVIRLPKSGSQSPFGRTYQLGGPEVVDFRGVYEKLFRYTCRRRALVPLPWMVAKLQAIMMSLLPNPPLTRDQVESLKVDNVVSEGSLTFADLGIEPKDMDMVLPAYLEYYCPGGRYGEHNRPRASK